MRPRRPRRAIDRLRGGPDPSGGARGQVAGSEMSLPGSRAHREPAPQGERWSSRARCAGFVSHHAHHPQGESLESGSSKPTAGVGAGLPWRWGQVPPGLHGQWLPGFPLTHRTLLARMEGPHHEHLRGHGVGQPHHENDWLAWALFLAVWNAAALTGNQGSPGTLRREEPASDPASNQAMASGERLILETTIHTTASSHIVKDD
jgi:hypothetical protein